nr:hypothetical protein [Tanacetum cinerariifolium]
MMIWTSEDVKDDEDDDMDIEADEEEEHPAPADSVVVAPTAADQALSTEETEPFETDESAATPPPHPAYHMTAKISILAPVPMPAWEDIPAVTLPPWKKLARGLRADYGFVATMDREIMRDLEREMTEIRELQAADRRRQTVILELLRTDHRRSIEITELRIALQGQVTALHGQ